MTTVTIHSCAELEEALFGRPMTAPRGRLRTHQYLLRGLARAEYPLLTNLQRLGPNAEQCEYHLLRNFQKYAPRFVSRASSIWHWLAIAQHHGLPTRLMDWTASPYVAMHFATVDDSSAAYDGAIWAVDFVEVHRHLPKDFVKVLDEVGSNVFSVEMITRVAPKMEALANGRTPEFVLFLEPPSIDDRIVNQFSLFSLPSCCRITFEELMMRIGASCTKFVIPSELKGQIRSRLDQGNVTERTLFPGLDGISAWLKRRYSLVAEPGSESTPRSAKSAAKPRKKAHKSKTKASDSRKTKALPRSSGKSARPSAKKPTDLRKSRVVPKKRG